MADLNIIYRCPSALKPRATNPRSHSRKQIRQIAESIKAFGFNNPVLLDARSGIIAGHGRVAAAELIGMRNVPTIRLGDLSETQIRAYVIADNRLAELAGWDDTLLALELQGIADLDLEFDLTLTGFETPEIDILIDGLDVEDDEDPDDEVPEVEPGPTVTRPGDLWLIGEHRLLCGNATEPRVYEHLFDGLHAQMVFTDPPYNVPINGHVSGLGKVQHREFAMATGEMSEAAFTGFLTTVFSNLAKASTDGAIHFICMDWRHIGEVIAAGNASLPRPAN